MQNFRQWPVLCLFVLLGACSSSPYSQKSREESTALALQQYQQAQNRIASDHITTVYAGYAFFSGIKAFDGDLKLGEKMVERMTPTVVKMQFSNVKVTERKLPYATEFDLVVGTKLVANLAEQIEKREGHPPLLVLLLTSHGSTNYLVMNADGVNKRLPVTVLANYLKPIEKYPTLLIISACHSGSLIPALQNDNRIIMTASSAEAVSFGCSTESDNTWFVGALDEAFLSRITLDGWFKGAATRISAKEQQLKLPASQPQLWVGKNMLPYQRAMLGKLANVSPPPPGGTRGNEPSPTQSGITPEAANIP